jgi:D-sedoheptulose 7-phosphate isomerase
MNRKQLIEIHAKDYFKKLSELYNYLDFNILESFVEIIIKAYKSGNTIYVCGNGGSAATASHFQVDFGFFVRYFVKKRIKIRSLTDQVPMITAIGNDNSYDDIFVEQMKDNFSSGDVLIAISASGNSKNVINAVKYANHLGGTSVALVGFKGGELKDVAQISLYTPNKEKEYGPIEDLHMIVDHMLVSYLAKDKEFLEIGNE